MHARNAKLALCRPARAILALSSSSVQACGELSHRLSFNHPPFEPIAVRYFGEAGVDNTDPIRVFRFCLCMHLALPSFGLETFSFRAARLFLACADDWPRVALHFALVPQLVKHSTPSQRAMQMTLGFDFSGLCAHLPDWGWVSSKF